MVATSEIGGGENQFDWVEAKKKGEEGAKAVWPLVRAKRGVGDLWTGTILERPEASTEDTNKI